MRFLAISGSGRNASTNTALLRALKKAAYPDYEVTVFGEVSKLPVFSPDLEEVGLPDTVEKLIEQIRESDGLILSSPEYVRAIPGGLKNAIDWLVSRDEIVSKPAALVHASHRGEDMLTQLRLVLSTVSGRFSEDIFLRFNLMKRSPNEISKFLDLPENRRALSGYLRRFADHCRSEEGEYDD